MTYSDVVAWVEAGGLGWFNAWPHTDCISLNDSGVMTYYSGSTPTGPFVPNTAQTAIPNWGHSENHGDKPPRKP